ncbi:heat shock protein 30 [Apodospora peruviana]|uniref:Heat shock protein 30 n=1 Tax=Apodospora peruviana TaxID=516989 RepID=A0AAE0HUC2_9PEZI|nr:heat shock protein 30 [Apodospora peruviana]
MGILFERGNDALNVHPPAGDQHLTTNGSNWLWALTAVFLLSFLAFFVLSLRPRHGERIFHYLFAIALLVGGITYFAQASDLAWRLTSQANNAQYDLATRQVFWAKYIFWVVAFPAIIIALGLLSTASWASIFYNVFLAWVWIICYLVSAFTTSNYKWGFFAFGTLAFLVLAFGTMTDGRMAATRSGVGRDFTMLSGWAVFLWLNYIIAFGISDGGNKIGVTPMFIYFGILDLLLVPVLAFATLALSKKWDYSRLNLHFTQYGRVRTGDAYPEKHHGTTAAPGAAAGRTVV